jgi:hypothetical protein
VTSIGDLMSASLLDVFGERDPNLRRQAIARTYAEDIGFYDPEGPVYGYDALDAKVQTLLDDAPGFVFTADGPVRESVGLGYLAWTFGPAGGEPVVRGFDIALVEDERILALHTMLL